MKNLSLGGQRGQMTTRVPALYIVRLSAPGPLNFFALVAEIKEWDMKSFALFSRKSFPDKIFPVPPPLYPIKQFIWPKKSASYNQSTVCKT